MSLLESHLRVPAGTPVYWMEDRGQPTPARFTVEEQEYQSLQQQAAVIDLTHGGVIALAGPDRVSFLSGLITNQIRRADEEHVIHAALLTPQGRYLWDFTIVQQQQQLLLLTEPDRVDGLYQQLQRYVLRSKVKLTNMSHQMGLLALVGPQAVAALTELFPLLAGHGLGDESGLGRMWAVAEEVLLWRDPRHAGFGWRLLAPAQQLPRLWQGLLDAGAVKAGLLAWEHHRITQALPRGGSELIPGLSLPLESGMLEMQGVDFTKGCYVGQETTSRSHYRATLKKRLYRIELACDAHGKDVPEAGTAVTMANGHEVGIITSVSRLSCPGPGATTAGLAILRSQDVQESGGALLAASVALTAHKPAWASWS
ncbi:MAG: folate-binding protein YgfZ [Magnetococcales bacterium]|nr:folate-binding protein YgfZ [Magnetococcales bacterium]